MAWSFGDSFDCYATGADMWPSYWDSGSGTLLTLITPGRFTGSQAVQLPGSSLVFLAKSSGVNDAVHHLVVAFRQTAAIAGSSLCGYLQLLDGTTGQCCIVFRTDGAILLTSGTPVGTVLDTYTGAFPVVNTWYAFEIEIVINNTTGSWAVRKNGNTVNDRALGSLNTRVSANNYANKLQVGVNGSSSGQQFDDLYWRSDASSVAWMGDVKCVARAPASDASVQFSRAGPVLLGYTGTTSSNITSSSADITSVIASVDGTVSQVQLPNLRLAYTGSMKCTVFANFNNAGTDQPGTIIGSATALTNLPAGLNVFTFSTPFTVVRGVKYWVGFMTDTALPGGWNKGTAPTQGNANVTTTYAAFPTATPVVASFNTSAHSVQMIITPTLNYPLVAEAQQDATTSYVYDSTPGHSDLYGIAPIASTPLTTFAVVTRAYMIKSDAGTRTAAVQLKSGASTVASPTVVLTPSNWQWAWRHDTTDPATGAAWTAAAVNVATVGPTVVG
jgi:hypothetical protein